MRGEKAVIVDASEESITLAASMLKAGRIVGVPTETVYGLAADASNAEAVARVFAIKGRPAGLPLIVHLDVGASIAAWALDVPDDAFRLASRFWPGPLTLVLRRDPSVLTAVTGGLDTVALRMPAHPVAQRLLAVFGGGLAAPSANRFGRVSPTTAHDVFADLGGEVDLVVDGGPCEVGIESTIVAFDGGEVTILRAGATSPGEIAGVLGRQVRTVTGGLVASPVRAPGMLESHYAPDTPLELCAPHEAELRGAELTSSGLRFGMLSLGGVSAQGAAVVWDAGGDIAVLARSLYRWLREADVQALDLVVVALPPDEGLGVAIRDRLQRAARRSKSP